MNSDVCYIGCFFTGERAKRPKDQGTRLIYEHIAALAHVRTSLITSFTFVVSIIEQPDAELVQFMNDTQYVNNVPATWIVRQNFGISYGAFLSAYLMNTVRHDWYIFIEDDYVPCIDDFDTKLVSIGNDTDADYLCCLADNYKEWGRIASISNGIINDRVLQAVLGTFKEQGHRDIATIETSVMQNMVQCQFSKMITDAGFNITDTMSRFRCQYYEGERGTQTVLKQFRCGKDQNDLFVPIQVLRGDTFAVHETIDLCR